MGESMPGDVVRLQPRFALTPAIVTDLMNIEASRAIVDVLPLPAYLELHLKQQARIRSAHYSTAIEGNPLDMEAARQAIEVGRRGISPLKMTWLLKKYATILTS